MSPRPQIDSYTGDEYTPSYVSPLKGINTPLSMFKAHRYQRRVSVLWEAVRIDDSRWNIRRVASERKDSIIEETVVEREFMGSEAQARAWLDYCVRTDSRFARAWSTFLEKGDVDWLLDWVAAGQQQCIVA